MKNNDEQKHQAFECATGNSDRLRLCSRAVASQGASGVRPPHLKSVSPHFTFGPPVDAYIQHCILKMCPPSGFWPLFLVFATSAAKSWRRACYVGLQAIVLTVGLFANKYIVLNHEWNSIRNYAVRMHKTLKH